MSSRPALHTLIVRHAGQELDRFAVEREGGRRGHDVEVPSPVGWPVGGQPDGLLSELRWYLEDFLDYPFDPRLDRAARVEQGVRAWGRSAFDSLFGAGAARGFYRDATAKGHERLRVQIRSDDPRVLAWPWEALEDPEIGPLALQGRVVPLQRASAGRATP